ncbi:EscU/YscU/HrcU family type III secretion system export apparatus switch protein [Vibrio aestuarianus]|uniref:EscU/YscU/HrcU family type III secretion system export apparatus switch protein n=1 Tax=Vibrio aestuarianus TaxID=28171 RepID=A0AAX3UAB0_9VIBR|nr:EscU/YscU/HrcU family type III secretion system export apparatus switch protein [Vibrio aestuarianus]MDE1221991.1 EscU/YscU/HrcU family type III secretion system export apparatus switch protein [Vibrio aestuarianus]MDE1224038.1 EscU/YscU/HrcU family type III secretion system export apparatus switch protein [Vibrio aestuarianus]MDE1240255.1 EscU/YscU/HrcU family type III secretion system export apparatus switch protein [Vibrio aestuarianus]MDE1251480.1 EscU/YscU/HrcU family type III secretion
MQTTETKKYPPTAKKLKDLQRRGQFPKTELAEPTLELLVFTVIFTVILHYLFEQANVWITNMIHADIMVGVGVMISVASATITLLVLLKVVVVVINWVVINKSVINTENLGFKIDKISPVNGFKNIFGIEAMSRSIRKILELLFLLFLLKYVFDVVGAQVYKLNEINNLSYFLYSFMFCFSSVSLLFVVYGICTGCLDYLVERYHFMQKNRMTFTEMRNELKETEGSPEIKDIRKQKMREVMESPVTKGRIPTFALANPTHILVPICYDPKIERIPVVLKIYIDSLAQEERKRLMAMNVPIIENKPLARAFLRTMSTGENFIPKAFYRDIALILSALSRYKNAQNN